MKQMGFHGMPLPLISFIVGYFTIVINLGIASSSHTHESLPGWPDHLCCSDDFKAAMFPCSSGKSAHQYCYLAADKVSITSISNQSFCARKPIFYTEHNLSLISRSSLDYDEFGIWQSVVGDTVIQIGTRRDFRIGPDDQVSLQARPREVAISDTKLIVPGRGDRYAGNWVPLRDSFGGSSSVEITEPHVGSEPRDKTHLQTLDACSVRMRVSRFLNLSKAGITSRHETGGRKNSVSIRFLRFTQPGVCVGLLILLTGSSYAGIYWAVRKRKLLKPKYKFFEQNGGLILEQLQSHHNIRMFTVEELRRATNNYHEETVLGERRFGKVYKGILTDMSIVIKEMKIVHEAHIIEKFVKRVIQLSQINHRNVVKLLGCCLETRVPLLVYEFVNDASTLFRHFHHNESLESSVSTELRLKIATEIAQALAYMHNSEASKPIIHGNVSLFNILLDDNNIAKLDCEVPYFNNLVDKDQRLIAQAIGYLDPEYFLSGKITEKNDVYSFGVALKELLTAKDTLHFSRPNNGNNTEALKEAVDLAKKCLGDGYERPTMKEVAVKLETLRNVHGSKSVVLES